MHGNLTDLEFQLLLTVRTLLRLVTVEHPAFVASVLEDAMEAFGQEVPPPAAAGT